MGCCHCHWYITYATCDLPGRVHSRTICMEAQSLALLFVSHAHDGLQLFLSLQHSLLSPSGEYHEAAARLQLTVYSVQQHKCAWGVYWSSSCQRRVVCFQVRFIFWGKTSTLIGMVWIGSLCIRRFVPFGKAGGQAGRRAGGQAVVPVPTD